VGEDDAVRELVRDGLTASIDEWEQPPEVAQQAVQEVGEEPAERASSSERVAAVLVDKLCAGEGLAEALPRAALPDRAVPHLIADADSDDRQHDQRPPSSVVYFGSEDSEQLVSAVGPCSPVTTHERLLRCATVAPIVTIRFPGVPDENSGEEAYFDLGQLAEVFGALDRAYISAFRLANPSHRRPGSEPFPRPAVTVDQGSVIVEITQDTAAIGKAVGALVTALTIISAGVRFELRSWRRTRYEARRGVYEDEVEQVKRDAQIAVLNRIKDGNLPAEELDRLTERAFMAILVGGRPQIDSTPEDDATAAS